MRILIHRGSSEIGGTCIRLSTEQSSILLDLGLPLSKNSKEIDVAALEPDAVLVSHPHQDHFGLIEALKPDVPVYMGELYMDADAAAAKIHECFLLADQIVSLAKSVCKGSDKLTIVGSDFHGSYLEIPDQDPQEETNCFRDPVDVLIIALQWMSDKAEK